MKLIHLTLSLVVIFTLLSLERQGQRQGHKFQQTGKELNSMDNVVMNINSTDIRGFYFQHITNGYNFHRQQKGGYNFIRQSKGYNFRKGQEGYNFHR